MAVPVRRTGKTKKNQRRQHLALKAAQTVTCPNCGAEIKSHKVCPNCGFYNRKKVMEVKEKAE